MTRSVSPGVAILDSDLRYVMLNSELAWINGVPLDTHLGKQLRDILGKASRPLEKHFESIFEGRQSPSRAPRAYWQELFTSSWAHARILSAAANAEQHFGESQT